MFLFILFIFSQCSGYGRTLMRKDKHKDTVIATGQQAARLINSNRYYSMSDLGDDVYEIKMYKKCVKWDLPIHLGYAIYAYAKLELLKFVYNMLQKFVHPRDYAISTTDTDSCYFSISKDNFTQVIEPGMRECFHREKNDWFPRTKCPKHASVTFDINEDCLKPPSKDQKCCYDIYIKDKREPGLWKLECESDSICALNAKSYICVNHSDDGEQTVKLSSKGVARSNVLSWSTYTTVFNSGLPFNVTNRGIRPTLDKLYTLRSYSLQKVGLSYLYLKRKVKSGGSETEPLDL